MHASPLTLPAKFAALQLPTSRRSILNSVEQFSDRAAAISLGTRNNSGFLHLVALLK
jgi:hypothetical protein